MDDRFDNAIKESELYLEELKRTLPMAIDLKMNSSSPYTPEGRLLAKKIHEVEEVISSLQEARRSVVCPLSIHEGHTRKLNWTESGTSLH